MKAQVEFQPSGRGKAQCAPDPRYPNGIAIMGASPGSKACTFDLPYPAPECGLWLVECCECRETIAISAAGRPDDPVSVTINCAKAGS